jgi:hypothetical protein
VSYAIGSPSAGWPPVSPSAFRSPCRLACLIPGQPRARLGEPASHVRVIHARPVGTASARSLSTGVADPLAMTRRGPADLPSGPGKLDMKPAGTTAEGGGLPVVGRAALIACVAAGESGLWRACLLPLRIRPDGGTTGISQDRLHVRSGMDRLIHSEIRLVQIRPPSSARPAHTPVDRKLVQPRSGVVQRTRC